VKKNNCQITLQQTPGVNSVPNLRVQKQDLLLLDKAKEGCSISRDGFNAHNLLSSILVQREKNDDRCEHYCLEPIECQVSI
jgi:hypothetical protein